MFEFKYIAGIEANNFFSYCKSLISSAPTSIEHSPLDSKIVVVLILYQKSLRADSKRLIEFLVSCGVSIVAVLTTKPTPEALQYLEKCNVVINRVEYGRDFAGYKVGLAYLREKLDLSLLSRIILMNDSIYVSQSGLDFMFERLMHSKKAVVAATENIEDTHHCGSFLLSLGEKVFSRKEFWEFWRDYKPTNIRPRIIENGELALSETLFKLVGNDYEVIYDSYKLMKALESQSTDYSSLLEYFRKPSHVHWDSISKESIVERSDALLPWVLDTKKATARGDKLVDRRSYKSVWELNDNYVTTTALRLIPDNLVVGSQVHQNAMLFRKYLNMPLVKNDLFYRGVLCAADIFKLVDLFPEEEREDILRLQFLRAPGFTLSKGERWLFDRGYI